MTTCSTCGENRPYADFCNLQLGGCFDTCLGCRKRARELKESHRWRTVRCREVGMVWAKGQSVETLLSDQGGCCAICKRDFASLPVRKMHVDHDHSITNKPNVRGLLCSGCNSGLGFFRDSPENLGRAADYLRGWGSALEK